MKRELMCALVGASFLIPANTEAQRGRDRGPRVHQPAPVVVSGRLSRCSPPSGARAFDCRSRVVYTSGTRWAPRRANAAWIRADWGRVRFAPIRYRHDRFLNQGELRALVGQHTVTRIRKEGRSAGLRGALSGEWIRASRAGRVLVVTMDRVDVAELVDFDFDGIVDDVYLIRHGVDRGRPGVW